MRACEQAACSDAPGSCLGRRQQQHVPLELVQALQPRRRCRSPPQPARHKHALVHACLCGVFSSPLGASFGPELLGLALGVCTGRLYCLHYVPYVYRSCNESAARGRVCIEQQTSVHASGWVQAHKAWVRLGIAIPLDCTSQPVSQGFETPCVLRCLYVLYRGGKLGRCQLSARLQRVSQLCSLLPRSLSCAATQPPPVPLLVSSALPEAVAACRLELQPLTSDGPDRVLCRQTFWLL